MTVQTVKRPQFFRRRLDPRTRAGAVLEVGPAAHLAFRPESAGGTEKLMSPGPNCVTITAHATGERQ